MDVGVVGGVGDGGGRVLNMGCFDGGAGGGGGEEEKEEEEEVVEVAEVVHRLLLHTLHTGILMVIIESRGFFSNYLEIQDTILQQQAQVKHVDPMFLRFFKVKTQTFGSKSKWPCKEVRK